ncbi:unnamed protein product [Closterium sp. NIES-64]|nr:unnamed protein product [Closterium sp. NIES-64]
MQKFNIGSSRDNIGNSKNNIGSSRDNIGSSRDNIGSSNNIGKQQEQRHQSSSTKPTNTRTTAEPDSTRSPPQRQLRRQLLLQLLRQRISAVTRTPRLRRHLHARAQRTSK